MEIIENKKNPLLHREEITANIERDFTPSNQQVIKVISEKTKKPEEVIIIEKISSKFGAKKFTVKAKVYDSLEFRNKIETVPRKVRKKTAKEAAEAAGKK